MLQLIKCIETAKSPQKVYHIIVYLSLQRHYTGATYTVEHILVHVS